MNPIAAARLVQNASRLAGEMPPSFPAAVAAAVELVADAPDLLVPGEAPPGFWDVCERAAAVHDLPAELVAAIADAAAVVTPSSYADAMRHAALEAAPRLAEWRAQTGSIADAIRAYAEDTYGDDGGETARAIVAAFVAHMLHRLPAPVVGFFRDMIDG